MLLLGICTPPRCLCRSLGESLHFSHTNQIRGHVYTKFLVRFSPSPWTACVLHIYACVLYI
ncbi:hypothetical protein M413DRAFT_81301 [Hebeloma cylindrosporum]|uniref:Uncharacterized protein n=1 Tax=Hebeloma cylindrosporum TaxID=76867 RepID=A0A0C2Z5V6_HEBCY|nr:hypothetical protein M413DRAFT_81301 [Hebeloma cylindrosporum h7]